MDNAVHTVHVMTTAPARDFQVAYWKVKEHVKLSCLDDPTSATLLPSVLPHVQQSRTCVRSGCMFATLAEYLSCQACGFPSASHSTPPSNTGAGLEDINTHTSSSTSRRSVSNGDSPSRGWPPGIAYRPSSYAARTTPLSEYRYPDTCVTSYEVDRNLGR